MNTDYDHLLKEWNARHSPVAEHLDYMAGRIAVEAARHREHGASAEVASSPLLWGKRACRALGACAAVLILVIGVGYFFRTTPQTSGAILAGLARPSAAQMGAFQRLFSETTRLFPKQLRWIVQSNGDIGLGIESDRNVQVADTPAMLVRLMLVTRSVGAKTWKPAWTTDIIMRGEDWVEIEPNQQGHSRLTLWVYPLDQGMVAVDTSIAIDRPLRVSARLDTVIALGAPTEVTGSDGGGAEYKLLQTVEPLDGLKGCTS